MNYNEMITNYNKTGRLFTDAIDGQINRTVVARLRHPLAPKPDERDLKDIIETFGEISIEGWIRCYMTDYTVHENSGQFTVDMIVEPYVDVPEGYLEGFVEEYDRHPDTTKDFEEILHDMIEYLDDKIRRFWHNEDRAQIGNIKFKITAEQIRDLYNYMMTYKVFGEVPEGPLNFADYMKLPEDVRDDCNLCYIYTPDNWEELEEAKQSGVPVSELYPERGWK